jgi:hypothetical protein
MAKIPEILAVIVEPPLGAAEDVTGWEFEENSLDETVLIVGGLVGQTREEAVSAIGEEQVFVVHVVERVHGAAGEKELGGDRHEAQRFQGDAKNGVGVTGSQEGNRYQEKKRKKPDVGAGSGHRGSESWNRHSCCHVSVHQYCFTDAQSSPMDAGGV